MEEEKKDLAQPEPQEESALPMLDSDGDEIDPMLCTTPGKISKLESDVFGMLQGLVFTMTIIVLLVTFVCPITKVSGASMEPTLHDGETLLVWGLPGYEPEMLDIIIVTDPTVARLEGQSIVKRVIALEGQTVEIDYVNNQVRVDGSPLYEPYLGEAMLPIYADMGVVTVPEDCVFVLGDNRNRSADSRDVEIGMVNVNYIKGKVILGVWPVSNWQVF